MCMEWEPGLVAGTVRRKKLPSGKVGNFPEGQPQDNLEFEACD